MFAFCIYFVYVLWVNFHLVGLHSYASGEAHSLSWIWYSLGTISLIGALAYQNIENFIKIIPRYRIRFKNMVQCKVGLFYFL
jgi:hypothetical protein